MGIPENEFWDLTYAQLVERLRRYREADKVWSNRFVQLDMQLAQVGWILANAHLRAPGTEAYNLSDFMITQEAREIHGRSISKPIEDPMTEALHLRDSMIAYTRAKRAEVKVH